MGLWDTSGVAMVSAWCVLLLMTTQKSLPPRQTRCTRIPGHPWTWAQPSAFLTTFSGNSCAHNWVLRGRLICFLPRAKISAEGDLRHPRQGARAPVHDPQTGCPVLGLSHREGPEPRGYRGEGGAGNRQVLLFRLKRISCEPHHHLQEGRGASRRPGRV